MPELHRYGTEFRVSLHLTNFFDRLDGTDLVVCKHNRNQDGVRTYCFFQFIHFYDTVFIYANISDLKTAFFQIFCSMQDRMMLNPGCDDVFAFVLISFCCCFQCPVICLRTTGCKINLVFLCTQVSAIVLLALDTAFLLSPANS